MVEQRIRTFLDRFPLFLPTTQRLNEAKIPWLIGGSGCLFLLGNDRLPDDVDLFLRREDHDKADELFGIESFIYTSPVEQVRNSNPEGEHSMQLTSGLQITINDKHYNLQLTPAVLAKRIELGSDEEKLFLLPPEEVLLIKALLQRGSEVGKHDKDDIKNFMAIYTLDRDYLKERIASLHAEERVGDIFG